MVSTSKKENVKKFFVIIQFCYHGIKRIKNMYLNLICRQSYKRNLAIKKTKLVLNSMMVTYFNLEHNNSSHKIDLIHLQEIVKIYISL